MQIKCEYCGAFMNDTDDTCPSCGGINKQKKANRYRTPKTIEQLQEWYKARNLPPYSQTRFFIGEDYKSKNAFGIYKDGEEFIVYKNKSDGSRAIRYQGTDEAYAVNEIYMKLKSEIINQKRNSNGNTSPSSKRKKSTNRSLDFSGVVMWLFASIMVLYKYKILLFLLFALVPLIIYYLVKGHFGPKIHRLVRWLMVTYMVVLSCVWLVNSVAHSKPTYYRCDDNVYVSYYDDYYLYDEGRNDYVEINKDYLPVEIIQQPIDYEYDASDITWNSDYSFTDSNYYINNLESKSSSNDWSSDSSYDWDSGSDWDSGATDWDSDW